MPFPKFTPTSFLVVVGAFVSMIKFNSAQTGHLPEHNSTLGHDRVTSAYLNPASGAGLFTIVECFFACEAFVRFFRPFWDVLIKEREEQVLVDFLRDLVWYWLQAYVIWWAYSILQGKYGVA
ncbi:hypothetical protein HD806DRAFT_538220 [Xylariaceae sp. AK1471]|nr:hypothetical protein HD806DRAFT_538220 [Xylariaceae sp. AK1471]